MTGLLNSLTCPYCGGRVMVPRSSLGFLDLSDPDYIFGDGDWRCVDCGERGHMSYCAKYEAVSLEDKDGEELEDGAFFSKSKKAPSRRNSPAAGKPSTKRAAPAKRKSTATMKPAAKRRTAKGARR